MSASNDLFPDTVIDTVLNLYLRDRGNYVSFRWCHPRKHYGYCKAPVYIDLGYDRGILRLNKLYLDGPPYGGWGKRGSHKDFLSWLMHRPAMALAVQS
jgi:hypothetical protein